MAALVYIETTIPSYLTAWRSPELSMAAKQQTTRQWWDERREHFELFISDAVLLEASGGDTVLQNGGLKSSTAFLYSARNPKPTQSPYR